MWLARTLGEHFDAVEADLHRYYQIDLLDLYRGKLSVRKLIALLSGLPRGSALHIATEGDAATWSTSDYLLANAVDYLAIGNWLFVSANSKKGARNPRPEPVPRPGSQKKTQEEPRRFASAKEVSAFLARVTGR
ncbi:hypothetical protein GCM10018965_084370 [Nonomuraea roseola]